MLQKGIVVGVGGRVGTMFAFELGRKSKIVGVAHQRTLEKIKSGKIFLKRGSNLEPLEIPTVAEENFPSTVNPDFIILAVRNPIAEAVKYYYRFFQGKEKFPLLILPQNGLSALGDAKEALGNVLGRESSKVVIARISLFNTIKKDEGGERVYFSYSLPIRLAFSLSEGPDILSPLFQEAGFSFQKVAWQEVKNMEYSKLFLNLIGMASAIEGYSLKEGFARKDVFKEEREMLREYLRVVKMSGGHFLNFPSLPVKFFSFLPSLPLPLLLPFRKLIGNFLTKKRRGKKKDFSEIDYYNGAVLELGKALKISLPVNEKLVEKAKKILESGNK